MEICCQTGEVAHLPDDPSVVVAGVDLHRAVLTRHDLRGRRFERCSFRNALLGLAQLDRVQFVDCTLVMAEFDGASLVGAQFIGGLAIGASFHAAQLVNATFEATDLSGAVFLGASLDGARFTVDPSAARLDGALYSATTSWPVGFDPTAHGLRLLAEPGA